jgi:hypothetical protein
VKVSTFLIKEKEFFWGEREKIIFGKKNDLLLCNLICYYREGGKMM